MREITEKEYQELLDDSRLLNALFAAGVGNWDGYDTAQEMIAEGY